MNLAMCIEFWCVSCWCWCRYRDFLVIFLNSISSLIYHNNRVGFGVGVGMGVGVGCVGACMCLIQTWVRVVTCWFWCLCGYRCWCRLCWCMCLIVSMTSSNSFIPTLSFNDFL